MISSDLPIKEIIREQMKHNAIYNIRLLRSNLEYTPNWCDETGKNGKVKQVKNLK